jgi:hypothetical protein
MFEPPSFADFFGSAPANPAGRQQRNEAMVKLEVKKW